MITVSAVIPTYNRAHTLARALASVFQQTRLPDEVIVVDDGSTDGTAEIVRRFPQARLVRLESNGGAAHARNAGAKQARCTHLAFLDSDDAWMPHKLERQLARIARPDAPALLCTGIVVNTTGGKATDFAAGPRSQDGWTFEDFQNYPFATSTWLIARDALLALGMFDETMPNCEDLDLLAKMGARHAIEVLPEALTVKYNQPDSLDAALPRTARSYQVLFERHRELWQRTPRAAARSYRRLANMHIDAQAMAEARGALVKGLGHRPWDLKSWALLAASLLGRRGVVALRWVARSA